MSNLKALKNRIKSVKSTQKITSAMKLVAGAKLRRAQDNVEAARPYAARMGDMISHISDNAASATALPPLLVGTGSDKQVLVVVVSADRGLCGGFNANIIRTTRREVLALQQAGKKVRLFMVGRKASVGLKNEFGEIMVESLDGIQGTDVALADAENIAQSIQQMLDQGTLDRCVLIYNRFISAIAQEVCVESLVPFQAKSADKNKPDEKNKADSTSQAMYDYEPSSDIVLASLLPRNLAIQIYAALLESSAGELAARMTAMDNATRNAGELIDRLTLDYNRTRQAAITTELIEIISGAEAL
ncbi:MAG: F0F1 ATP synthase subunit gamma [Proteobacteria bacterium]|nr:F0F1 ATP synthase subunit gamma [Pseudomonadota bacterium]